ncbi:uncharacterized protein LOC108597157 [Drosophila busckii]|uniref:uncharacterized protein LOC108597157 n=1 Tax=Drosophila busckii TaxID=30019 RepID=UPI00083EB163|nr:uncharacterized protein LOC108597157 [Drosophila busckii]
MRLANQMLTKFKCLGLIRFTQPPDMLSSSGILMKPMAAAVEQQRRFAQNYEHYKRKSSALQSMREFFMHPLTWDRNNGYLNVLLCLAIVGFCFMNSCTQCPQAKQQEQQQKQQAAAGAAALQQK